MVHDETVASVHPVQQKLQYQVIKTKVPGTAKVPDTTQSVISGIQPSTARTPSITQAKAIILGISPALAKAPGTAKVPDKVKVAISGTTSRFFKARFHWQTC